MNFNPDKCPECGEPPAGILEEIRGIAWLQPNGRNGYDYSGDTDVWWDTQIPVTDEDGRVGLRCDNFHEWWAAKHEGAA